MAALNLFNIEGRGGPAPAQAHVARVWTEEEKAEKLSGYLDVPAEFWDQIRYGSHVRYETRTNGFRPGGFVMKNPLDAKPKAGGPEKRFMKLQNGFNDKARGYQQWVVAYEDVSNFYVKPDAAVLVMMQTLETAVTGLNANIRKLAEHAKKLEQRIGQLER